MEIERPHCTSDLSRCFPRYNYFIRVDEDALRSIVCEAPPPPKLDICGEGHVNFVNAHWKSQLELYPDEVNEDEQAYEPVDGCCKEDVGRMEIASDLMEREFSEGWSNTEIWHINYRRPPDMLHY